MQFNVLAIAVALFASSTVAVSWNGTTPAVGATTPYSTPTGTASNGTLTTSYKTTSSAASTTTKSSDSSDTTSASAAASSTGAAAVNGIAGSAFGLVIAGGVALVF